MFLLGFWQIGLICKASSVASHQTGWHSKKNLNKRLSFWHDFSWIENSNWTSSATTLNMCSLRGSFKDTSCTEILHIKTRSHWTFLHRRTASPSLMEKKRLGMFDIHWRVPNHKGALSNLRQLLATENPLKILKNAFYFILKALLVLKLFKFFSWLFGYVKKRLN